jgi:hypothetical protein
MKGDCQGGCGKKEFTTEAQRAQRKKLLFVGEVPTNQRVSVPWAIHNLRPKGYWRIRAREGGESQWLLDSYEYSCVPVSLGFNP